MSHSSKKSEYAKIDLEYLSQQEIVKAIFDHFGFTVRDEESHRGNPIGFLEKDGVKYELEQFPSEGGKYHRVLITTIKNRRIIRSSEFSVGLDEYMLYWIKIQIPLEICSGL